MSAPGSDHRSGRTLRSRLDPQSWSGALLIMALAAGIIWLVEVLNVINNYSLNQYGMRPRNVDGLEGIVTMPFLHAGTGHTLANTVPFVMIGWLVLIGGLREFVWSTLIIVIAGGLATWLVGPSGLVVGASGLIFGWLAYVLGRAWYARKLNAVIVAAFAVFFFTSLFAGLLPSVNSDVAWQAHVCGFAAGLVAAWILHPRKGSPRELKRRDKAAKSAEPPGTSFGGTGGGRSA